MLFPLDMVPAETVATSVDCEGILGDTWGLFCGQRAVPSLFLGTLGDTER